MTLRRWASVDPSPFRFGPEGTRPDPEARAKLTALLDGMAARLGTTVTDRPKLEDVRRALHDRLRALGVRGRSAAGSPSRRRSRGRRMLVGLPRQNLEDLLVYTT